MMSFVGEYLVGADNYSTMLLNNVEFREMAKLASTGPNKNWFEQVILGEKEPEITLLFQKINFRLVSWVAKAGEHKRDGVKGIKATLSQYELKVLNMLQDKSVGGLVSFEDGNLNNCERIGVVVLVQILSREFNNRLCHGLATNAEKASMVRNESEPLPVRDVNQIFGWAIFNTRLGLIEKKRKEFEGSIKEIKLTNQINFLSEMRMYASEAVLSDDYVEKYYDLFLRSTDRGYMTLVREKYCGFGLQLMDKLSRLVTQQKLKLEHEVVKKAKISILEDIELKETFLDCCESDIYLVGEKEKMEMFVVLVTKTANARFSDELRAFRQANTVRGCKKTVTGQSLRAGFKGRVVTAINLEKKFSQKK